MSETFSSGAWAERRSKPRVQIPFPARVHGVDTRGEQFETETILDNLSARGFFLRMLPSVEAGARLTVVISLISAANDKESAPRVQMDGTVLRVEEVAGGVCGVAATFDESKFL
ncbi:MAG: PilZ domain-containing protein [Acidobacteriota bacterium]|nr:PilZ domain-containing protein [Acidobacteriota bacterium]